MGVTFEQALEDGDLDVARAILDELAELPDTGDLYMPECYADLAREYDRQGRHDDAITLHERRSHTGGARSPILDRTSRSFTCVLGDTRKRPLSGPI
jgi:hypothetical protein